MEEQNVLITKHEELKNYGSKDWESPTHFPYVRCNTPIPRVPANAKINLKYGAWSIWHGLDGLNQFPQHQEMVCMECAGNSRKSLHYEVPGLKWDNRAVSNIIWSGPLLRDVINPNFMEKGTSEIVFTSHDKLFTRSLPIEEIYKRPVMIATKMNNRPLMPEHGYPTRLIVPGWYGMASVKWLKEIALVKESFEGEYQTEKYTYKVDDTKVPVTVLRPKSIITSIGVQTPVVVKGKAWSGCQIDRVEVSDGREWKEAKLTKLGEYGWVGFECEFDLEMGKYRISSRATDKDNHTQPETNSYNFYGYGNNAIQSIEITI
jgi:sulfane dehydrogenase subunit SoxC